MGRLLGGSLLGGSSGFLGRHFDMWLLLLDNGAGLEDSNDGSNAWNQSWLYVWDSVMKVEGARRGCVRGPKRF